MPSSDPQAQVVLPGQLFAEVCYSIPIVKASEEENECRNLIEKAQVLNPYDNTIPVKGLVQNQRLLDQVPTLAT